MSKASEYLKEQQRYIELKKPTFACGSDFEGAHPIRLERVRGEYSTGLCTPSCIMTQDQALRFAQWIKETFE